MGLWNSLESTYKSWRHHVLTGSIDLDLTHGEKISFRQISINISPRYVFSTCNRDDLSCCSRLCVASTHHEVVSVQVGGVFQRRGLAADFHDDTRETISCIQRKKPNIFNIFATGRHDWNLNSLTVRRFKWKFRWVISKWMLVIGCLGIAFQITLRKECHWT